MKKMIAASALAAGLSVSMYAQAYDWTAVGTVTSIDITSMPVTFRFSTTAIVGSCPVGTYLVWKGVGPDVESRQANVKAVFASVLAAKLAGVSLRLNGSNAGCLVSNIYLE